MSDRGFTIVELAAALSAVLIVGMVATPKVVEIFASFDRRAAREQLALDLSRARTEAMAEGVRAVIEFEASSYSVGLDRLPFNNPPESDSNHVFRELPNNISIDAPSHILINNRGYLVDADNEFTTEQIIFYYRGDDYCAVTFYTSGTLDSDC